MLGVTVALKILVPPKESLRLPWQISQDTFTRSLFLSSDQRQFGLFLISNFFLFFESLFQLNIFFCWAQFNLEIVGLLPLFSRIGSVPSSDSDIKEEASEAVRDDPKPCCNCLGRDTIANAAARISPAVVNLSVPQGIILLLVLYVCY